MKLTMRLYQKTPGGIYYVGFERGKARSLKTKDLAEARKLYAAVKREYLAGRLAEIRGESRTTLGEFREEYDKWARDAREPKTYKADMLALQKLVAVAGESAKLDKLTLRHADLMIAACRKRGNRPGTINAYVRHLRSAARSFCPKQTVCRLLNHDLGHGRHGHTILCGVGRCQLLLPRRLPRKARLNMGLVGRLDGREQGRVHVHPHAPGRLPFRRVGRVLGQLGGKLQVRQPGL